MKMRSCSAIVVLLAGVHALPDLVFDGQRMKDRCGI